ncbi:MAG: hypothetical protein QW279_10995 [Candidatus Jordarchaeaceae archaeon]
MRKGLLALGIVLIIVGVPLVLSPSYITQPNPLSYLLCYQSSSQQGTVYSGTATKFDVSGILFPSVVTINFNVLSGSGTAVTVVDQNANVIATIPTGLTGGVTLFLPAGTYYLIWSPSIIYSTVKLSISQYNIGLNILLQNYVREPAPITQGLMILGIIMIIAGIAVAIYGFVKEEY